METEHAFNIHQTETDILNRFLQKHPEYAGKLQNNISYDLRGFLILCCTEGKITTCFKVSDEGDILKATDEFCSVHHLFWSKQIIVFKNFIRDHADGYPLTASGILDEDFNIIMPAVYGDIRSISFEPADNNYFRLQTDSLYGVMNKDFKEMIPVKYEEIIYDKNNERFFGKKNGGYEWLDKTGNFIKRLPFVRIFIEYIAGNTYLKVIKSEEDFEVPFEYEDQIIGKTGLLDTQGNVIIPPGYELLQPGPEFIIVMSDDKPERDHENDSGYLTYDEYYKLTGGKWGVADYRNKIVIPVEYSYIMPAIKSGEFLVNNGGELFYFRGHQDDKGSWSAKGGKWGIVNSRNKVLVPVKYPDFNLFSDKIIFKDGEHEFSYESKE